MTDPDRKDNGAHPLAHGLDGALGAAKTVASASADAAKTVASAGVAVPRAVAWTALYTTRRLGRRLRKAGMPMPRLGTFKRRSQVGAPPGTLISHPDAPPPVIRAIGYGPDVMEELEVSSPAEIEALKGRWPVLWINVDGVGDAEVIAAIGDVFDLHRLALEDVMNVHQRPKMEEYSDYLFGVARAASLGDRVDTEQISFFLGMGWVLTFQERAGDSWDPVRDRLRLGRGRIRTEGADYLFYTLLDATVDGFYPVLEEFGARMEHLEEEVIDDPRQELVGVIHGARRDVLALRHAMWPMREAVNQLYRDPHRLIAEGTQVYLRDVYDHVVQVIDLLENYREMSSGLLDVYLSSVSHRMNEVMKVLTIIATIFIPLTFIAGIYGMNFDPDAGPLNMPELGWAWGYPAVWAVMIVVALSLLWFFRRRRWL